MPMEVARTAVAQFSKPGDTVLDPMCGSGVVARAAQLEGRRGIGRDVDPLAVYLSWALCSSATPSDFKTLADAVLRRARALANEREYLPCKLAALPDEDRAFVGYWFSERAAAELFALADALGEASPAPEVPFAAITLSACIISRSGGASMAMDLSRSRPHRVPSRSPRLPFDLWSRNSTSFTAYLEATAKQALSADIRVGDARRLDLQDESVDVVITSPPYVNAIDYLRTSKFSLIFFDRRLADLREIRAMSVGTERGLAAGNLPRQLEDMVEVGVADERRKPLLRRYTHDMFAVLLEARRVLRPGGQALFVVGPSILSRRAYDGATVLAAIANVAGFELMAHDRRDLSPANRSLPPPERRGQRASLDKRMTCELYVALRKSRV
ncbi:MAG: hypothetical protein JOZ27_02860 [Caulobacteraceae bacterium]|nr:hypothetical protein [Caulobacteraceae bacterium]